MGVVADLAAIFGPGKATLEEVFNVFEIKYLI